MWLLEIAYWFSVLAILYIYLGYPVVAWIMGRLLNREIRKSPIEPTVTILTAAYNEAANIEDTIRNKLALDYPADKREILVISDSSDDGTDDIVRRYEDQGVRLIRQEPRQGKTSALNLAVPEAKGEILVFSDANSIYAPEALRAIISNFADPKVGYVTGKMIYTNPEGTPIGDGCSSYMKYENFLRDHETRVGSVVGVDGGIDAVRKDLYVPMNPDQLPDFVLPLRVVEQGCRVVYEPGAILKEPALKTESDEYRMRVRVSLRSLWALWDMRHLLSFKRYGLFAWQLLSHKVMRYLAFVFILAAFVTSYFLMAGSWLYTLLFLLECGAAGTAVVCMIKKEYLDKSRLLALLHYFVMLNAASAHAFVKFLSGKKMVTWTPRKG